VTAGLIVRGLLDIGGLCFGLAMLGSGGRRSSLYEIGCLCFGVAAVIDLLRPW
jgi:hypothetical protein